MVEMYGPERHDGQLGRRLGPVEPAGRARLHPGNAATGPHRGEDPEGRLREPAGVLLAVQAVQTAVANTPLTRDRLRPSSVAQNPRCQDSPNP